MRFRDFLEEAKVLLGVNEDGRARTASFGARVQLALRAGALTQEDAEMLRAMTNRRNIFVDRVQASLIV